MIEVLLLLATVVLISSTLSNCGKSPNYAPSPRPRNEVPETTKFQYKSLMETNDKDKKGGRGGPKPKNKKDSEGKKSAEQGNKTTEKEKKNTDREKEEKKKTEKEVKKEEEKKKPEVKKEETKKKYEKEEEKGNEREKEVTKREEATQVSRIKTSEPAGDDDGKRPLISVGPKDSFEFPYDETSQQRMIVKNLTKKSVCIKIRASCLDFYRISPVFAIIAPEDTCSVIITHIPSAKKEDKLYVVSTEAPKDVKESDLPAVFKPLQPDASDVRVNMIAK